MTSSDPVSVGTEMTSSSISLESDIKRLYIRSPIEVSVCVEDEGVGDEGVG